MDEQPGTSKNLTDRNDPDEESSPSHDQRTYSETDMSNYSNKSQLLAASTGIEKQKKPSKPEGKFNEKRRRKRRNTGRVEKQRKPPARRHMTKRAPRRKPRARCEKKRDFSISTMYSRLSSGGLQTPACERCGHRCCLRRYERRVTIGRKRKFPKKRKQKFQTVYKSENIQVGSCSKMLSPLNVNVNATGVEEAPTGTFREITPEMIHEALRRLSMWRQNVETGAIFDFIERNYPVNQDKEALAIELLEKLEVAVLVGIAKQTSIDTWALCGALEKPKFNDTHVTLFWKVYRDTMTPIQKTNKAMETSKDASEKQTLRVYDLDIL